LTAYGERAPTGELKTLAADSRRLQARLRHSLIMLKVRIRRRKGKMQGMFQPSL
jgi:hypothetical protein